MRIFWLLLLVAASALLAPSTQAQSLKVGGTGAAMGTMRLLADAFNRTHQAATIEILPSLGSGGGIKAVAAGAIDLAVSSRALKDEERAQGLQSQSYGRTAVVFATSADNPVDDLSSAELIALFGSGGSTWPNGAPARPILRPKVETDTSLAETFIPGMKEALEILRNRPEVPMFYTDQEAADALERIPGSVGTLSLSLMIAERRKLKALSLDGRAATVQTIADGSYPIAKTFYFILPADPSQFAKDFVAFAFSPEGQAILARTGHQTLPAVSG